MQLHRCRFVEWQPSAIVALAFAPISSSLAVARDNGDIELWSVPAGPPHCAIRIPGRKSLAIKALAWAVHEEEDENSSDDDSDSSSEAAKEAQPAKRKRVQAAATERTRKERLFSAALNGQITEWDLTTLRPRTSSDSYGGGVWSLACNAMGTILAAACEDGSVRLFDTSDDSMRYMRALPTQPQRACSVAFHAEGLELVAGYGDGCIRRWHTRTGQAAYRLTVEAQDNRMVGSTPVVWAILVLQDWTIVSGDSLGKTRFWDGRHGTLLHSFDQHTADVLCLAKNKMENKVWSAGIDAKVSLFQLVQEADAEGRRWLHTHSQRAHTHDIQALACAGQTLVSGGLDTLLQVYSTADFDTRAPRRVLPYPHRAVVHSAAAQRLLLSVADHALDVYRLASDDNYAHLVRINLAGDLNLTSSALAPNGALIACSDAKQLRLFKLEITKSAARASAITSPAFASRAAYAMSFSADSTRLCTASDGGDLHLFDVSLPEPVLLQSFSHTRATLQQKIKTSSVAPVASVCISADNKLVASGDSNSVVHVFDLASGKHHASLPVHAERLRQISFHPRQRLLVALYANNSFVFYDCDERRLADWSREYGTQLPADNALLARKEPLLGVAWNPARLSSLLFYGEAFLCHVDLDLPVPGLAKEEKQGKHKDKKEKEKEKEKEKRKSKRDEKGKTSNSENFSCVTKYRPLMHVAFLGPDELVAVERPWVRVAQALPEALHRHTYRSGA